MATQPTIDLLRPPQLPGVELSRGVSVTRTVPPHWHSELQLCMITAGGGDLLYKGTRHHTPAGTMFAVHPGEVHANETALDDGCSYCTFNIDASVIQRFEVSGSFHLEPVVDDATAIESLLDCDVAMRAGTSTLTVESMLLASLAILIERHGHPSTQRTSLAQSPASVKIARDFLIDNPTQNVSLTTLAQLAGLSPFHFARTFRDSVGIPPHRFQMCVRLERAKDLLRRNWNVGTVAAECGFFDQSHFVRMFKRVVGITPSEYRKPQDRTSQNDVAP